MANNNNQVLRSSHSIYNAFILFVNKTQRTVGVYWVDYEGKFLRYITLRPDAHTLINTYSTHPWIFKDFYTGERMQTNHNDVYWPKPFINNNGNIFNRVRSLPIQLQYLNREEVYIHFPLRTLRLNALWVVVKNIKSFENINKLDIPNILKNDLKSIFKEYKRHILEEATIN